MPYNYLAMERRIKAAFPRIKKSIYRKITDLDVTAWLTKEPVSFKERETGKMVFLKTDDNWGGLFDCAWMNFKGKIPAGDSKKYVLIIDISGEGLIVDSNGSPVQGITTFASMYDFRLGMPGKRIVYIEGLEDEKGNLNFWVDAGNNDLFGNLKNNGTLVEAYVAECNFCMLELFYDFEVLNELRSRIPENKARHQKILSSLYKASLQLDKYTDEEAEKAGYYTKIELSRVNANPPLSINAIGHSHIDLAWLWPIRESIRKGARTFSTVLKNMERYPDYIFGASQPQLYQWIKNNYPQLYNRVKKAVADGRWELQGAMWVESDTNITGGEALIRQMLYGKKFYQNEFGVDVRNVWLPDVFGYSAALPQIMKKSDVDYFMTIKISWSEFNDFPHHTFLWKGLDGSEVLAHMPPEGTYNSSAAPRAIFDTEEKFADKLVSDECLLLYGIGDGGGGPGEEHLERLKREKDLQGLAPVNQGFASEFFNRISKNIADYKTWQGELYLEHHRGTYTSEGRNKRFNKLMENLLRDAEIIGCITGEFYDSDRIEKIWKEVLLYQFHDILPGSSIKRVYDESLCRYELLEREVNSIIDLGQGGNESVKTIFNTLSWKRNEWINCDGYWKYVEAAPMSYFNIEDSKKKDILVSFDEKNDLLENDFLKVKFNKRGLITSVWDKKNLREAIKAGEKANEIKVYRDEGDAWDFPHDYRDHSVLDLEFVDFEYILDGPEAMRINRYHIGSSKIIQEIVLTDDSGRIDIRTKIDWNEKNTMIRSSFPISVSSSELTCGIQFGYIERPSLDNTLWDMAKIEVCGQNYVDISQDDYGVAIISDYKYGYSSTVDSIDICLLRSTTYPDVEGDIGLHEFTYSLYPHYGNHLRGGVIKEGIELSRPLRLLKRRIPDGFPVKSFVTVNKDNIIVETVKKSEEGNGLIIRLYEAYGLQTVAAISFNKKYSEISETNLIERQSGKKITASNKINLTFGPFEIKTLLLR